MLEIKCPHCGKRSQKEFSYGGDANLQRPELKKEVSDKEWDNFVYYRDNPRGNIQNCGSIFQDVGSGFVFQEILPHTKFSKQQN